MLALFNRFISHPVSDPDSNPDTKEKYIVAWNNLHVQAPFYRFTFSVPVFGSGSNPDSKAKYMGKPTCAGSFLQIYFGSGFGSGLESKVHGTMS